MNPRITDGGLQLGASCRNRHHDRCPSDIDGGISISVIGIAALDTTEASLTLAVLFGTVPAHMARLRRVAGINGVQWHTCKSRFVGKKHTQLPESPGGMARTLGSPNRAFRTSTDVS
jgi:hypothetical protein